MEIKPIASGSTGNCYYVSDGFTNILLDAGIPMKKIQQAINFKLSTIAATLITHRHNDHSKAVKDLVKAGVDVYSNKDTQTHCGIENHHRGHILTPNRQIEIGTFIIMPFEAIHDVPNFGYIIYSRMTKEKLLYLTDSMYNPVKVPGLTHIIMETNWDEDTINLNVEIGRIHKAYKNRTMMTHMSIDTAVNMLKANDMSQVQQI